MKLILPFIPPTANHTQKHALRGKHITRYNTTVYKQFIDRVQYYLYQQFDLDVFSRFLESPHKVTISIYSPRVLTKKGEVSKTFGDVDNFIKPLLDAVYKPLGANDALVMQITASKHHADKEYTVIEWEAM